jgi:hypothetical protein
MAKETCRSCDARLTGPTSFCQTCGQPTHYASDSERLEWDLKQWRKHVDRSVAGGVNPSGHPNGHRSATAVATVSRAVESRAEASRGSERPPSEPSVPAHRVRLPKVRRERPARPPEPRERVIDLDADMFAYRVCPTCDAADWIVRTNRNPDETWNYWCVRCSRSFKTELRLPLAWKPFLSAAIVIGGLLAASFLMLR